MMQKMLGSRGRNSWISRKRRNSSRRPRALSRDPYPPAEIIWHADRYLPFSNPAQGRDDEEFVVSPGTTRNLTRPVQRTFISGAPKISTSLEPIAEEEMSWNAGTF